MITVFEHFLGNIVDLIENQGYYVCFAFFFNRICPLWYAPYLCYFNQSWHDINFMTWS
jgi:hypothetical protein